MKHTRFVSFRDTIRYSRWEIMFMDVHRLRKTRRVTYLSLFHAKTCKKFYLALVEPLNLGVNLSGLVC